MQEKYCVIYQDVAEDAELMRTYTTEFFTYFGCTLRQEGEILSVVLTPELADHFGKPHLRLVFHPEHAQKQTELVTAGSYIVSRMYDFLKSAGEKVAVALPKRIAETPPPEITSIGPHCTLLYQRSREVQKIEAALTFRLTYYSDEKIEELLTACVDAEGELSLTPAFPYPQELLRDAARSRFALTRQQAKAMYDRCLEQVETYACQQAAGHQITIAERFHENIARLDAYYQQMIDEVPVLEKNRAVVIRQLEDEHALKMADELNKCQMQVAITPLSFCTISMPFRRYRYVLTAKGEGQKAQGGDVTLDIFHNLFSGEWGYPRCESCGHVMKHIGICEGKAHPVCQNCLVECHTCGAHLCRDCGMEVCFECGEWVCRQCSQPCHICGERFCDQHLLGCQLCRDHFCRQCAEICEICQKPVEKIHLTACEISYTLACPNCIGVCTCCRKQVRQDLMHFCAFCGQQACPECTFRCAVCGKNFCVHHIAECELTKRMVCPRHLGTCGHCARRMSTTSLHACDVCRKQVCDRCAVRCHGCGAFFCHDHAEEMFACPACGKMYCALCYPGHQE